MTRHSLTLFFLLLVSHPAAFATPLDDRLIDYLVAIEGVRMIKSDADCSYAARRVRHPEPPYSELLDRLPSQSRRELETFMRSPEWTEKLRALNLHSKQVAKALAEANDTKTACGMWVGFAVTALNSARRNFDKPK